VRITRRKGEAAAKAGKGEDGEFETEFLCAVRFAPLKNKASVVVGGATAMGTAAGPATAAAIMAAAVAPAAVG
jgi:hypothetical protein